MAKTNNKFESLKLDNYKVSLKEIVENAIKITNAEIGVVYLTYDDIFLEACEYESIVSKTEPPAALLPTYTLNWNQEADDKLGGITAFVAIRKAIVNLNKHEVKSHRAWKGKWDEVFLEGVQEKCKGILAIPLIGNKRCHGVLKVENPKDEDVDARFKKDIQDKLEEFSKVIAQKMDENRNFWKQHIKDRAMQKIPQLVELLERGKPLSYNLPRCLSYIMKLFAVRLERETAIHFFWTNSPYYNSSEIKCHYLIQKDPSPSNSPFKPHEMVREEIIPELYDWLINHIDAKIIQNGKTFPVKLEKEFFNKKKSNGLATPLKVDIIRLKINEYDLGAIILPRTTPTQRIDDSEVEDLTKLAINLISTLGRFVHDEYEANKKTYLPLHRPTGPKECCILFADIRNFSQLTHILRISGKYHHVEIFIKHFCEKMGKVVNNFYQGRIDKFTGDGLMALFGEYTKDDQRVKKISDAVLCSLSMVKEFNELYKEWFEKGLKKNIDNLVSDKNKIRKTDPLKQLFVKFNENVEIKLAIGINIGEVYLDYFGHKGHFEYTAIGDNMNYTQRLENAAARNSADSTLKTTNILLSQTAYFTLKDAGILKREKPPLWLRLKGFGYEYPVYELFEDDIIMQEQHDIVDSKL